MILTSNAKPQTSGLSNPVSVSASLLSEKLSENWHYYRSKILTTPIGINPLIAAASALLMLSSSTTLSDHPDHTGINTQAIFDNFIHEVKAFESHAKTQGYASETILLARYILCEFLDTNILSAFKNNDFNSSLLGFFYQENQENQGSENFFLILEKLSHDPDMHIDLLELIYICLSLGYAGKYSQEPQGKEILEKVSTQIFELIRRERGDLKKDFHILPSPIDRPPISKLEFPLCLIIIFTLAVLLTVYSSFSYRLSDNAENLYQQIQLLNSSHEIA